MSSEPVRPEARTKYVKYAGGTGLGWSRRICTLNAAAMGAVLTAAYSRGLTVDRESSGAIYVEGAGVYDPGFPMAGKPAPAWFVPHPIKETP